MILPERRSAFREALGRRKTRAMRWLILPLLAAFAGLFTNELAVGQGVVAPSGTAPVVVPLPPPRPDDISTAPAGGAPHPAPGEPAPAPPASQTPAGGQGGETVANTTVSAALACHARLSDLGATFRASEVPAQGTCGIEDAVVVEALAGGVRLRPPAILECATAEVLAHWLRDAVMPAVAERFGHAVSGLVLADSFECRTRNHVVGAPLSEHALGHALDVVAIELAGIGPIQIAPSDGESLDQTAAKAKLRRAACDYFTTVLGPGSDPEHASHLHLDTKQRGNGYRICE